MKTAAIASSAGDVTGKVLSSVKEKSRDAYHAAVPESLRQVADINNIPLAATKKLLQVARGEAEGDDWDNLAFQSVWGPEDIFAERVSKDSGSFRRQLLNSITYRHQGDISKIPAGALSKQIDSAMLASGLATNTEEINALSVYDGLYSLTKIGEGGISGSMSSIMQANEQLLKLATSITRHLSFLEAKKIRNGV